MVSLRLSLCVEETNVSCFDIQNAHKTPFHMGATLTSQRILSQLTIGPALDFAVSVGLPPRILQPRYVVAAGSESLRVATLAFVGGPLMGDRPSERGTLQSEK